MATSDQPRTKQQAEPPQTGSLPHRKPADLTWESFAERRIREAQEKGAFANLPGRGQPIPGIDQPLEENWWLKQKLRNENLSILPPTLEARRKIEHVREDIRRLDNERDVRRRIVALNETIRQAIYSTAAGPPAGVQQVDVEAEVEAWRQSRSQRTNIPCIFKDESRSEIDTLCTDGE